MVCVNFASFTTAFPALMCSNPTITASEINWQQYEVLACEPLHDITNFVQNIINPYTTNAAEVASTLLTSFKLPGWSITTEKSQDIIYGYPLFFFIGFDNSLRSLSFS
jgi:hypothetical protein